MHKILFSSFLLLCACTSVTVIKHYPPVSPDHIQVILDNDDDIIKPSCSAEQIGRIVTGWLWSGESAIKTAKEKAAEIGGDYIKGELLINELNDGQVRATVYKCR